MLLAARARVAKPGAEVEATAKAGDKPSGRMTVDEFFGGGRRSRTAAVTS
jgi:hypothetical protein